MTASTAPEVLVIGSGAGGAAAAWVLASRGVKVLVLEAGPRFIPRYDYPQTQADWESRGFPDTPQSPRYTFAPLQQLDRQFSHLLSRSSLHGALDAGGRRRAGDYQHVRGVGGSTLHYSGEAHRLHPQAMRMHSRFGVAADWPLDYAELEPYYQKVERLVGVAGPQQQGARWRSVAFPQPAHALSYCSQRVTAASSLNWQPNSLAILSQAHDGRPACNYCAACNSGCPRGDKGSADVTFMRAAENSGNCRVEPRSSALKLVAGDNDRIDHVLVADPTGDVREVRAKAVIVACGALETPRLLLNSQLGNESGQVGRNFMETLYWQVLGLHADKLGSHRGLPVDAICWDFNAPDAIPGVPGGMTLSIATPQSRMAGPVSYATRLVGGWGRAHKQAMRERFGHAVGISSVGECLPNEGSFIDLDDAQTDTHGLPLPRIHSHLDATALQRLEFMRARCHQVLAEAGIETPLEETGSYDQFNSTHVFGTCRMGEDAQQSVVDRWGRSHRWRNLYIADASVFPSSGGGEAPSLTIQALAVRTAEQLLRA